MAEEPPKVVSMFTREEVEVEPAAADAPDPELVEMLEQILARAKTGEIRAGIFIGPVNKPGCSLWLESYTEELLNLEYFEKAIARLHLALTHFTDIFIEGCNVRESEHVDTDDEPSPDDAS